MRAAVFKAVGQPLAIEQRPDPTPGEGEVVLKVARCGICGTDLAMSDGSGQTFELIRSSATSSRARSLRSARACETLKVGDRIAAMPFTGCGKCATCLAGRPNFCVQFRGMPGAFAEFTTTAERVAIKLPKSVSLDDGALD